MNDFRRNELGRYIRIGFFLSLFILISLTGACTNSRGTSETYESDFVPTGGSGNTFGDDIWGNDDPLNSGNDFSADPFIQTDPEETDGWDDSVFDDTTSGSTEPASCVPFDALSNGADSWLSSGGQLPCVNYDNLNNDSSALYYLLLGTLYSFGNQGKCFDVAIRMNQFMQRASNQEEIDTLWILGQTGMAACFKDATYRRVAGSGFWNQQPRYQMQGMEYQWTGMIQALQRQLND